MSSKHKRAKRACDLCRQRKVRCNGLPDSNCTQCTQKGQSCSWTTRQNKRGRKPTMPTTPTKKRKFEDNDPPLKKRKTKKEIPQQDSSSIEEGKENTTPTTPPPTNSQPIPIKSSNIDIPIAIIKRDDSDDRDVVMDSPGSFSNRWIDDDDETCGSWDSIDLDQGWRKEVIEDMSGVDSDLFKNAVTLFMTYINPLFTCLRVENRDVDEAQNCWNYLYYHDNGFSSLKTEKLIMIAKNLIIFACGSKMLCCNEISSQYSQLLDEALMALRMRDIPITMSDILVNVLILKNLFLIGTDQKYNVSLSQAYLLRIANNSSDLLQLNTKHRIFSFMLLNQENDFKQILSNINDLPQETQNHLPNIIILLHMLSLRVLSFNGSWDSVYFTQNHSCVNAFYQYIEKSLEILNENQNKYPLEIINPFINIIYNCKSLVNAITVKNQDTVIWATKSLSLLKSSKSYLHMLLNPTFHLILIFRTFSKYDLENESRAMKNKIENYKDIYIRYENGDSCPFVDMKNDSASMGDSCGVDISDVTTYEMRYDL